MCTTVRIESGHREHRAFAFFFFYFFFFFFFTVKPVVWEQLCGRMWQRSLTSARHSQTLKWSESCLVVSDSLQPHGLFVEFSRPEYWSGWPFPSPEDLPNPGIKPRFPALQADSLPDEPPGKPKNTGEGSLSLLQGNFPTQESNRGLLHCRRILDHWAIWDKTKANECLLLGGIIEVFTRMAIADGV